LSKKQDASTAITTSNIGNQTVKAANSVAWGNVSGKPSTFPPASHNHNDQIHNQFARVEYAASFGSDFYDADSGNPLRIFRSGNVYFLRGSVLKHTAGTATWLIIATFPTLPENLIYNSFRITDSAGQSWDASLAGKSLSIWIDSRFTPGIHMLFNVVTIGQVV